jgi:hypothetical protein
MAPHRGHETIREQKVTFANLYLPEAGVARHPQGGRPRKDPKGYRSARCPELASDAQRARPHPTSAYQPTGAQWQLVREVAMGEMRNFAACH